MDDKRYLLVASRQRYADSQWIGASAAGQDEPVRGAQGLAEQYFCFTAFEGGVAIILGRVVVNRYCPRAQLYDAAGAATADSAAASLASTGPALQVVNWQTRTIAVHPEPDFKGMHSPDETPCIVHTGARGASKWATGCTWHSNKLLPDNHDGYGYSPPPHGQPILLVTTIPRYRMTFKVLDFTRAAHTWNVQGIEVVLWQNNPLTYGVSPSYRTRCYKRCTKTPGST